ncbi:uncharacterized protein LOC120650255 [Panicum virgatum]|uniref:Uncharacterized protein n=1 Tax=Panicum virgatum TaxID=38727 RepID=A0A8T0NG74_PANVG|nr:uncharacterized protein LOC120650255 [Panicum virgatum]KAG2547209.1 hypothetical protein PVAP13_9KG072500 [Panicum virgatum]
MLPAAVAGALPRRQAVARASVSALAASLPLLYVSLLRPPPAALAGDTAFWFLMSNCVIAAIVATSADAGALLFRPAADDDDDGGDGPCRDDGLSCASAGQPPPVDVQAGIIASDAVVPPLAAAAAAQDFDQPPAVDVDINGGRVQREAGSVVASSYSVHRALPSLIEGGDEEEEGAGQGSEPRRAEMSHPFQQRGEDEEDTVVEPSTVNNSTVEVEAQGEEDIEVIPLATIEEGSALAEPEPEACWARVTSTRSVPVEEAAAAREGGLRRSATVGSKPAEEESEYWQLSDEELNRRVEDFIARFNREIRRQAEQEASSVLGF